MEPMPPTARAPRRLPSWTWWLALAACVAGVALVRALMAAAEPGAVVREVLAGFGAQCPS